MKKTLKKIGILFAIHILGWGLSYLGSLFLSNNSESAIGSFIVSVSSLMIVITFIWVIVVIVKAIINKSFKKTDSQHLQPQEITYYEVPSASKVRSYTYNTVETADELNWPLLIFLTLIIPPFGIYYTIKKILIENASFYKNGTKLSVIGGVLTVLALLIFALPVVIIVTDGYVSQAASTELILSFLNLSFALVTLITGLYIRHLGFVYDRILYMITVERITKIDELSKSLKLKKVKLIEKVLYLINNGILNNAYYYPYDNEIIVAGISKKVARRCKSCAATTVFYSNDKDCRCVYCGAEL
ncbi:MAG: hypothetical protein E7571_02120 [Ruminococcaceae bacterium]|nr:hypothetical protein [Oscillospiraceae bacterium]